MTKIKDIISFTETFAPLSSAADFDNSGLLVGSCGSDVSRVLIALDITRDIVTEAKEKGADLIISHHPVIFNPIKNLSEDSVPYLLAKLGINALCLHTNLDIAKDTGVNMCLADTLGLKNTELFPEEFLAIGTLPEEMSVENLSKHIKSTLNAPCVTYTKGTKPIRTLALCSGAGGDMYDNALNHGADAFLTGEAKHHEYLYAEEKEVPLIAAGHFSTEDVVIAPLMKKFKDKFPHIEFIKSEKSANPFTCI